MLKVSPHISPRTVVDPPAAIRSLVVGAQLSHYNYLTSAYRSPNKYDHFHAKTYISSFIPSFRSSRFAHIPFDVDFLSVTPQPADSFIYKQRAVPRKLPPLRTHNSPLSPSQPQKSPKVHPSEHKEKAKLQVPVARKRKMVCMEDGQMLSSDQLKTCVVDFEDLLRRYVAFDRHGYYIRSRMRTGSLASLAVSELLETVSASLSPEFPFTSLFLVNGERIEDLLQVPKDCEVLLFSRTGDFLGLEE